MLDYTSNEGVFASGDDVLGFTKNIVTERDMTIIGKSDTGLGLG